MIIPPCGTTSLAPPKDAKYLSTVEWFVEVSAASCSGEKLLHSHSWPQWSCYDCPWCPIPFPVLGVGPKVWTFATDTSGLPRFLFFNVANPRVVTLRDSVTLLQNIIAYYTRQVNLEQCLHHHYFYYHAQKKNINPHSTVGFKDNICSSVFKAACRLLQARKDIFSWVGFKPGLLPRWMKPLSAVFN